MTRMIEVVKTPADTVKLTITKTRITMKFPETLAPVDVKHVTEFFMEIASKNPNPTVTLRGRERFNRLATYGMTMYNSKCKVRHHSMSDDS